MNDETEVKEELTSGPGEGERSDGETEASESGFVPDPEEVEDRWFRGLVRKLDDEELRRVLLQYLLCRPDTGEPWLFLSKKQAVKFDRRNVYDLWTKNFQDRHGYEENDRYRGVSPHYGRHFFSTWWRVEKDAPRPLVKYMRGDLQSGGDLRNSREAIDSYIHPYYEDIEPLYRSEIFKLRV